ncbi:SPFH domain-containing protein [Micropruina sp.]|uniref:SPFH domain-containing protein n=1 Tax=Micropruina sp. TaxID=2737536 RepID=UPI0039E50185
MVQLFGRYRGNPAQRRSADHPSAGHPRKVSVKVRNLETNELEVNDADGNPVNIAAIIVWQVADTAKAVFAEVATRIPIAGLEVVEARISSLAYAPSPRDVAVAAGGGLGPRAGRRGVR